MTGGLLARHEPSRAVSFGADGVRSAAELARDVEALRAVLPAAGADDGALVLLVFASDRHAFAAAVLASWASGFAVLLPPDTRRESVGPLQKAPGVAALLHDTKAGAAVQVGPVLSAAASVAAPIAVPVYEPPPGLAARFVGSDGSPEDWTGPQLIAAARAVAGAGGLDARVLVSVSPLSAFGFVAGALAPMIAGGAFSDSITTALPLAAPTVVTVPAHLRTARPLGPPGPMLAAARAADAVLLPAEVRTGSTTAGLPVRAIAGLVRPDTAILPDRTHAIARALVGEAGAVDAGAWALPCSPGESPRLLAAAASPALSPRAARSALDGAGIADVERVIVVSEIPRDALGRLDATRFVRLFGLRSDGAPLCRELSFSPATISRIDGRARASVAVRVPEDYAWYAGHFPGYPIMAGVVQLHELVMPAVASVHPGLGELRSVTNVKFHKRIVPGDTLELGLSWPDTAADDGLPFDFEIRRDAKVCAAGRLTYHPGATAT